MCVKSQQQVRLSVYPLSQVMARCMHMQVSAFAVLAVLLLLLPTSITK
jgi:hypothetical protein